MSLALDLLKNPGKASESVPVVEPKPRNAAEEIRDRLFEQASKQKSLTLSVQEAIALRQFIEALEADPFSNAKAVLDTLDMQKLELQVDDTPVGEEDEDPFTNGNPDNPEGKAKTQTVGTDRVAVDTAVVAPDATPYHDEPIPASVLASLQVLQSNGQEQPVNMSMPAPAPVQQNMPTINGRPIGGPPSSPAPPVESRNMNIRQAPVLAESDVPIQSIMGNWRRAFKKTRSE